MSLPNHIAIIPDGNRRWSKERNLPTIEGHRRGFDVAVKLAKKIRSMGVHTLTLWAFSTENWTRAKDEVSYLMNLYSLMIDRYLKEALEDNVRVVHLGRKDRLPKSLEKKLADLEEKTRHFTEKTLNLAIDYGGQDEILRGFKKMQEQGIPDVSIEEFNNYLDTHDQTYPKVDLILRTGGEMRTSGLMLWQAAYAEYIFFDKYFPDMTEEDIEWALSEYENRERRFGK